MSERKRGKTVLIGFRCHLLQRHDATRQRKAYAFVEENSQSPNSHALHVVASGSLPAPPTKEQIPKISAICESSCLGRLLCCKNTRVSGGTTTASLPAMCLDLNLSRMFLPSIWRQRWDRIRSLNTIGGKPFQQKTQWISLSYAMAYSSTDK